MTNGVAAEASASRHTGSWRTRRRAPTIAAAASAAPSGASATAGGQARCARSRSHSSSRVCATAIRPSDAIVALCTRMWPADAPKAIIGHPQLSASSEVTPPVEWISTSAARISSSMRVVNPSTVTRPSLANRRASDCSAAWLRPATATTATAPHARAASTPPARSPTPQPPPLTTTTGPSSGRASARRAVTVSRSTRKRAATNGATSTALPGPATRSTGSMACWCITRWTSAPRCAQTA